MSAEVVRRRTADKVAAEPHHLHAVGHGCRKIEYVLQSTAIEYRVKSPLKSLLNRPIHVLYNIGTFKIGSIQQDYLPGPKIVKKWLCELRAPAEERPH